MGVDALFVLAIMASLQILPNFLSLLSCFLALSLRPDYANFALCPAHVIMRIPMLA